MRLDDDDFTLFGLPPHFALDRAELDARWKALQREVHPDRFVAEGPAARHQAMQWALRANEAYQRLKAPLARAGYLCELRGQPLGAEDNTAMPRAFLLQQMAWREALEEAGDKAGLDRLAAEVRRSEGARFDEVEILLDQQLDWAAAAAVRALMYVQRFAALIEERLDRT